MSVEESALEPLGVRDNNPWNLQQCHVPYLGLAPNQKPTGELVFESMLEGMRAGFKLCYAYGLEGKNTPLKFVTSFSPSAAGNPTAEYVANVCDWTGFTFDQVLDFHDEPTAIAWARSIWRQEQGLAFAAGVSDADIRAAIAAAQS